MKRLWISLIFAAAFAAPAGAYVDAPSGTPDATVDLGTRDGAALTKGEWRYSDAKIVEVDFHAVGPDRKPSGPPNRTYDIVPHAGAADFDDSKWAVIDPTSLAERRSTGKLCVNWYRLQLTIPESIGDFATTGSTAVFSLVLDDYAEVWVDGKLPRDLGQMGGNLVAGWNAPNRVVIGRNVKPGQTVQLAIFGINGPISDTPSNYIWIRSAKLEFFKGPRALAVRDVPFTVDRLDPALDSIVPRDTRLEKLAENFQFTEGPIWLANGNFCFSDPNANRIYEYSGDGKLTVFREQSGYQGADVARYGQPGSNGLTLDRQGSLTLCEHGNHRITRLEKDGSLTVLADKYMGKRLNSPNDLVYRSDGTLYFSDPPFGLPKFHDDPARELDFFGVFCVKNGVVKPLVTDLRGPNGLAFSPDEKWLYVGNWDEKKKHVYRYPVNTDGSLGEATLFYDFNSVVGDEAIDGVKVDRRGNVYISGPGGLWIVSPEGKALGTLKLPELAANFAWGGTDGSTLYLTARTGLYRVKLGVPGIRPEAMVTMK